jgi:hypothetical protein
VGGTEVRFGSHDSVQFLAKGALDWVIAIFVLL